MKTKIIILSFTFFCFLNTLKAQNADNKLSFEILPFHGKCFVMNGKHFSYHKVKKLMVDIPESQIHFKNIRRLKVAGLSNALGCGVLVGFGISLITKDQLQVTNGIILMAGVASILSLCEIISLQNSEKKQLVEIYNNSLHK